MENGPKRIPGRREMIGRARKERGEVEREKEGEENEEEDVDEDEVGE